MNFPDYHLAARFDKKISNSRKIAVIGTGQVGATFAFALMTSTTRQADSRCCTSIACTGW